MKGKCKNKSWGLFVALWLGTMLVLTIVLLMLWVGFGNTSVAAMRWLQFGQTLSVFVLPTMLMAYLWSDEPVVFLHLKRPANGHLSWMVVLTMLVAMPGLILIGELNSQIHLPSFMASIEQLMNEQEAAAELVTEQLLSGSGIGILILNVALIGLLPALGEELTFRGLLQWLFTSKSTLSSRSTPHVAIWCTAIVFSFVHFQFAGFIPRMLMGALFGYLLAWSGSIWMPILMHFTNNAAVVIMTYMANNGRLDEASLESFGTGDTLWLGGVSLVASVAMILVMRKRYCLSNAVAPEQ